MNVILWIRQLQHKCIYTISLIVYGFLNKNRIQYKLADQQTEFFSVNYDLAVETSSIWSFESNQNIVEMKLIILFAVALLCIVLPFAQAESGWYYGIDHMAQ